MIQIQFKINEVRLQRGMSITKLSEHSGVQYQQVSNLCNGKNKNTPTFKILIRIAQALNCTVKDLFSEIKE